MRATSIARECVLAPVWRRRILGGTCALALAASFAAPAQAQFVCDSTTPGGADGASASGTGSVACGTDANAVNGSASFGIEAGALADPGNVNNAAFGPGAGRGVTGSFNTGLGVGGGSAVTGDSNVGVGVAAGQNSTGDANTAIGRFTGQNVLGSNNVAIGDEAGSIIAASHTVAIGTRARGSADGAVALGFAAAALGENSIAIGTNAVATGSVAMGNTATAGNGGVAFGDFTTATGTNSTAIGPNATATHANAAAFGNGATTTRANQQVFGTASNTYTTPGITSSASKSAQGSPTHLVTSNASGDLAAYTPAQLGLATAGDIAGIQSDIDALGRRDEKLTEGLAAVASLAQPIILPGQTFAMRAGWGGYDDASAVGFTAAGVVAKDVLRPGFGTVVLDGGVGVGTNEGEVAGRAGFTFGW
jgi:trimeric autotransporter adhesin